MKFKNRGEAGLRLAQKLTSFKDKKDVIVLGLTRGGVITAKQIAKALNLPLDFLSVKKITHPKNTELAIGAVAPRKTVHWEKAILKVWRISAREALLRRAFSEREMEKREEKLSTFAKHKDLKKKTVILVDDGVATGATIRVAEHFLKKEGVKEIILAAPVIAKETHKSLSKMFPRIIALSVPKEFRSVGEFYEEFSEVSDEEVVRALSPN